MTCPVCGSPVPKREGRGRPRTYCDAVCHGQAWTRTGRRTRNSRSPRATVASREPEGQRVSETKQRNRRSGRDAEEWARKVQRAHELATRDELDWDAIAERLGLDLAELEECQKRVREIEEATLVPVECFGLMKYRGRYVPVRVAVAGADVEPLTGRTPIGAPSTTGFSLALGRVERELRDSARRALQGKAVVP